jgi:hypothetical protein
MAEFWPRWPMCCSSLTIDYTGAAPPGDWLEAQLESAGQQMIFANCYLSVGDTRVARASAVFVVSQA